MKNTIISISLIIILFASTISSSYGDLVEKNYKSNTVAPKFTDKTITPQLTKHYTINLDERHFKITNQELTVTLVKQPQLNRLVKIGLHEDIFLVAHSPTQAIVQRLSGSRKGEELDNVVGLVSSQPITSVDHYTAIESYTDPGVILTEFNDYLNSLGLAQFAYAELTINQQFGSNQNIQPIFDFVKTLQHDSSQLIFIFAVAAFYIIVRSELRNVKFYSYTKTLSIIFALILCSSAITAPYSIASSYYAHAQLTNDSVNSTEVYVPVQSTDSIVSNSTDVFGPVQPMSNETSSVEIIGPMIPSNQTQTIEAPSN
ncbi:MAG: hypothetical protein EB163_09660, partial [Nitrososphaeria archaeon]|nr:hypothetical protein [Nitrososphaeria archaeon]